MNTPAIHPTAVLVLVLASYTMIMLDISIINTALPKIDHALGFSSAARSWVRNAYLLTFGGLLLLGTRASPTRVNNHATSL
jgi:MFS family permease